MTKEEYLKDNEVCPKCDSDFDVDRYDTDYYGPAINVSCACGKCGTHWTEIFKLIDIEIDD